MNQSVGESQANFAEEDKFGGSTALIPWITGVGCEAVLALTTQGIHPSKSQRLVSS
jgi:hypothetical protein